MAKLKENQQKASRFDGSMLGYLGINLLASLISVVTLTIGTPWALCMVYRWQAKHTQINGKRLVFDGKGIQLLGTFLKWIFFTVITVGIFALWIPVKSEHWRVKHTHFAEPEQSAEEKPAQVAQIAPMQGYNGQPLQPMQFAQPVQFTQPVQLPPVNGAQGLPQGLPQPLFPLPPFPYPPCYMQPKENDNQETK